LHRASPPAALLSPPPAAHPDPPSFPTRRSSDLIADLDAAGSPVHADPVVDPHIAPDPNRAMDKDISCNMAAITHQDFTSRLGKQAGLRCNETTLTEANGFHIAEPGLHLLLPGQGPGTVLGLQGEVQPRHIAQATLVPFTVTFAHGGKIPQSVEPAV